MSGFDDELDAALGGAAAGGSFDDELEAALGGGASPKADMTIGEPEVIRTPEQPTEKGLLDRLFAEPAVLTESNRRQREAGVTPRSGARNLTDAVTGFVPGIGAGAAIGGVLGGLESYVDSDKRGADRLVEGAQGAALGAGLSVVPEVASAALKPVAKGLGELGRGARNYVLGGAREIADVAKAHGFDNVTENLGDLLKQYSPTGLWGAPMKDHLRNVSSAREVSGGNLGQLRDEINSHLVPPTPGGGSLMPGNPGDVDVARKRLIDDLMERAGQVGRAADDESAAKAAALERIARRYSGTPATSTPAGAGRKVGDQFTASGLAADDMAAAQARATELEQLGLNPSLGVAGTPSRPGRPIGPEFETDYLPGDTQAKAEALREQIDQLRINPLLHEGAVGGSAGSAVGREFTGAGLGADALDAAAAEQRRLAQLGANPPVREAGAPGRVTPGTPGRSFEDFRDIGSTKAQYARFARPNGAESVSDNASRWAAGEAGSSLKRSEDALAQLAPEPIQRSFAGEKQKYGDLATLEALLQKRTPVELTGGDLGGVVASSALSAVPGALVGYAGAQAAGQDELAGALGGAGAAFGAGMGFLGGQGATRTAARQYLGRRGTEIGANMLEAAGRGIGSASEAIGASRTFARSGAAREAFSPDDSRGHLMPQKIEQLLTTNPRALGRYAQQLTAAKQRGELSTEVSALMDEPEFRQMMRGQ